MYLEHRKKITLKAILSWYINIRRQIIKLTYVLQVLLVRRIAGSSLTAGKSLFSEDKDEVTPCQFWTHLTAAWAMHTAVHTPWFSCNSTNALESSQRVRHNCHHNVTGPEFSSFAELDNYSVYVTFVTWRQWAVSANLLQLLILTGRWDHSHFTLISRDLWLFVLLFLMGRQC